MADPYRTDPDHKINQAISDIGGIMLRLDDLDKLKIDRRLKDLERQQQKEFGFLRTNWNNFWVFVGRRFNDFFCWGTMSTLFFFTAIAGLLTGGIHLIREDNEQNYRTAVRTCEYAHLRYVDHSGDDRVTCIREDGAVLTIVNYHGTSTLSMPAPAPVEDEPEQ